MKPLDLPALISRPVAECASSEAAEALTRSFEGYVVPLRFTPEAYERRFRGEDLDPYASRIYERDGAPAGVVLISRRDFARLVAREGEAGLPWNLTPETLSAVASPARAFCLGDRACALIADPDAERLALTALVVPRAHRRQGWGTRLLRALSAAFPGRPWAVTPVVTEGWPTGSSRRSAGNGTP